jgi:menaquinone-dependent protoporphyrinogen oxidase
MDLKQDSSTAGGAAMTILVAYGSKRGGTEGLAHMVGDALRWEGFTVEVAPARTVRSVGDYDVVIVGGALYAGRWHKDARKFVRRHVHDLRRRPVYLFSSGPLDDSATEKEIPPVKGVKKLMGDIGARGHVTFCGRLAPDARGIPASAMAKENSGDWRDARHVQTWVHDIVPFIRTPVTLRLVA